MNLRNLSAWSIGNPVVPIVLFIGLMIAGVLAFLRMDVTNNPDVQFPAVIVTIVQPGAAPSEIETQITQKVESAVRSISGVEELNSTASEGSSSTVVNFAIGTDPDVATNQVKNSVDQVRGSLPDGILEPQVRKLEINGGGFIGIYSVRADDMTMEQLSWFVDDTVAKSLLSVPGMASVQRLGGVDREIRVIVDPVRMQSLGVTAGALNAALRQINVDAAGGRAEIAGSRQSVRVLGNASTALGLRNTQLNLGAGRTVRLGDIATVRDGYSEQTRVSKRDGRQVVTFLMQRARNVSDVAVYNDAIARMQAIVEENPGIHFAEQFTPVPYVEGQYHSSIDALLEGAVLAVLIVFLFLRDWRATLISALAIPLSAIPTFWFMELMGFNLNFLSLLALSLVAGVLVDDAIVEIENIVRHMRMGKSAYQASIDAADEIGLAVVATTFSIVAVFLPVALMPGIPGQFFKAFGGTVVVAVLMSLAVARMITPMAAAYFLKAAGPESHGEGPLSDGYMRILAFTLDTRRADALRADIVRARRRWWYLPIVATVSAIVFAGSIVLAVLGFQQIATAGVPIILTAIVAPFLWLGAFLLLGMVCILLARLFGDFGRYAGYLGARIRARLADHRVWMLGVGILAFALTIALFYALPQQFQPNTNEDTSQVSIEMVPGTTLAETERVTDRVAALLQRQPEVEAVTQAVREGDADLYLALAPADEREATSIEFERRMTPAMQGIADARVSFNSQNGGGGSGRDITVMLSGSDPRRLQDTAQELVLQMRRIDGVVAPRVAADLQRPELLIVPRFDLAAQLGVTTASLSQAVRIATLGEIDQNAARFSLSDRQVPIRVILARESRQDFNTIANLPVPTATGGSVPLRRVAEIRFGAGPTQIQRYNQSRRIFVGADLGPGKVSGPINEAIQALPLMQNLPAGISNEPVGADKWQGEMIQSFMIAVVSGVLLVFAVLVLLYRRFVSPLVNMTSLLLAPLGGLLALGVIGQPISMPVYIGMLMLLGIVAKNSILLIDFAIEEMQSGVPKLAAILDAGHKRAQPIVMTTVAMTAGMVPTALSLNGDGAWRAPMGTVVIGGLILSTVLTLVIVPAGFSLADGMEKRLGPWLRRGLLTYRPGEGDTGTGGAEAYPAE